MTIVTSAGWRRQPSTMDGKVKEDLLRVERYIEKMPSLPPTVAKILEVCNSPAASPADLNRVISVDPVLTARVLRLINSAYYGLPVRIVSMVRAIIMLGINTVKNLALSTAVVETLERKTAFHVLDSREFWRHSLAVGATSRLLARRHNIEATKLDDYFVAGLLHDIGKIPIDAVLSDHYRAALERSIERRLPLHVCENEFFGFDHSEVGRRIVEAWNLGDVIRDTVTFHHEPEKYDGPERGVVEFVHVASWFVNTCGIGSAGDRSPRSSEEIVRRVMSVIEEGADELKNEANAEVERAEVFLKLV